MSESTLRMSINNLPRLSLVLRVGIVDIVRDDRDSFGIFDREQFLEYSSDYRFHTGRYYYNRDRVGFAPGVKVFEARVEADI